MGEINQLTPLRVLRRRKNILRKRKIKRLQWKLIDDNKFEVLIHAQAGTYIKEFITGDEGRTTPSISELLNTPCECLELDVVEIYPTEDQPIE